MSSTFNRLCIYPKDIMSITGKSYPSAVRILKAIRIAYRKPTTALVTFSEFCTYMNLDIEEVKRVSFDSPSGLVRKMSL